MSQKQNDKITELLERVEEAVQQSKYEDAARFLRRIAAYSGLSRDMNKFRIFMAKAGDLYRKAAEDLWKKGRKLKAALLFIEATKCYNTSGSYDKASACEEMIYQYYFSMRRIKICSFEGSAQDLKHIGDFLRSKGDLETAEDCYCWAAEKAAKEGKFALSGGLYRDAGDCSWHLGNTGRTAEEYSKAAEKYIIAKEYFEAAWHYNISGFLFILDGKFKEASEMARKAGAACLEGKIPVILDRMSRLCGYLSKGYIYDAEREWSNLRRKMKANYVQLIERCFMKVRAALKDRGILQNINSRH